MVNAVLETIFVKILQMNLTASVVILAVFLIRLLLRNAPKIFSYVLWIAVLFRLLCPVSFSSVYSVFSIFQGTDTGIMEAIEPGQFLSSGHAFADLPKTSSPENEPNSQKAGLPKAAKDATNTGTSVGTTTMANTLISYAAWIWLAGIFLLAGYNAVSLFYLHKKLKNAVAQGNEIYSSRRIDTPFVLGIRRPRIYLPTFLKDGEREYILCHEQVHIQRKDYLFRFLSFLAVCLHWFNPLVWAAFICSGKDMEMSCDEAVIRKMGENIKKEYSSSLLNLTTGNHQTTGFLLQFGESDTKRRVKNVLHYKKITAGAIAGILLLLTGAVLSLVSDPKKMPEAAPIQKETKNGTPENGANDKIPPLEDEKDSPKNEVPPSEKEKTFEEAMQGAFIDVNVRSISKSAKIIDLCSLLEENEEWEKHAQEMDGFAFAENCTYRINYANNKIQYTETDFDTFADVINKGETDVCKYCSLTFEKGLITAIDLLNGNYMDGISYTEKFPDQSWYETVMENKLYDTYIKLSSMEADVAETAGNETIEVYTDKKDAETGMIIVKSSQGKILYTEKTDIKKSGLIDESINLGTAGGTDFLMTVHAEDRETHGVYNYEVFHLDENGDTLPIAGSSFSFKTRSYPFSKTAFQKWVKEMDSYYKATKPLIIKKGEKIITNWDEARRNKYHEAIFKNYPSSP